MKKKELLQQLGDLDEAIGVAGNPAWLWMEMHGVEKNLEHIYLLEELYWQQRTRGEVDLKKWAKEEVHYCFLGNGRRGDQGTE